MKILVTGGAGFIGSHLVDRLLKANHKVLVVDNLDPFYSNQLKQANIDLFKANPNYEFACENILSRTPMGRLVEGVDVVYHFAAQAGVRASIENPVKTFEVNIKGTFELLGICLEYGVKKFINASSSSVYGNGYLPFDEEHPTNPISPYGVSKLAAEHYCRVFYEVYGLKTVNLRYFTVYGTRMRPDLAINIFTRKALKNEPIEIFGDGFASRDFTYIDDITNLNIGCLYSNGINGESFNVGTGERITISQLALKIKTLTKSDSEIVYSNRKKGDMNHTLADISKAKRLLGYEPTYTLDLGLKLFRDWVEKK